MRFFAGKAGQVFGSARVLLDASDAELRELARPQEKTTEYGSPMYVTGVRNRLAKYTEIVYGEPTAEQKKIVEDVVSYLEGREVVVAERTMCQDKRYALACRLMVTKPFARIALMWQNLLFPRTKSEPDLVSIAVPEWPEKKVLVDAEAGVTFVLGSDYTGEEKKSFLRMAMYRAKQRGALGLHAGSKILKIRGKDGVLNEKGAIFFGLSGTGKTSLTCHHHWLRGEEGVVVLQDDVVFLEENGACAGTENNFYIKTEGLTEESQPLLYHAAVSGNAFLENIFVGDGGAVNFSDESFTSNGRAVVMRKELAGCTRESIDLEHLDLVFFITRRNDVVPPVAKLSAEQGAAAFMLGESIETSAGDPTQAGKARRVVGTNPFIVGPAEGEGNRFYELLLKNPGIRCYLLNTGSVGGQRKITIEDTCRIIAEIARERVEWRKDGDWGYLVASKVEGMDINELDPKNFYSPEEYAALTEKLRKERVEWLSQFPTMRKEIPASIGCGL